MQPNSMSPVVTRTSPGKIHAQVLAGTAVAFVVYALVYLLWFLGSPLGRYPLLDSAENLNLAQRIATGTLPPVPFFRAMLYPALLSLFLKVGIPSDLLPTVAGLLGCLSHLGAAAFVYRIAHRLWGSPRAGLWAAVLYGFNPVALYFSAEPLDTTLGILFFLAGLDALHSCLVTLQSAQRSPTVFPTVVRKAIISLAGGSALWTLAMLTRPHYAVVLAALPLVFGLIFWRKPRYLIVAAAVVALVAGGLLCCAGFLQKCVTGTFRIMPTQGGYSLWAGNRPGANGRYYEQRIHFSATDAAEGENPARIESEVLYRRETGAAGPLDADLVNQFWRAKTVSAIKSEPGEWLRLMLRKSYFLVNDFEQYNNKTFLIQKTLCPWLKFNPLGWGVTFVLCSAGLVLAFFSGKKSHGGLLLLSAALIYSAGVVLFFVSDRFRLPLLPFVCIGGGVLPALFKRGMTLPPKGIFLSITAAVLAGVIALSRGWGAHDLKTAVQDYVALSIACGKAGDDIQALDWARKALETRPDHPDALGRAATSYFNCRLRSVEPAQLPADETWEVQAARIAQLPQTSSSLKLVQAVALWKTGRAEEAKTILINLRDGNAPIAQQNMAASDDAIGVLLLTRLGGGADEAIARARAQATSSLYLLSALARCETASHPLVPAGRRQMVAEIAPYVSNLFP